MAKNFPEAWDEAYQNAGKENGEQSEEQAAENTEHNPDLEKISSLIHEAAEKTGFTVHEMNIDQILEHWKAVEQNHLNLVAAELGDETAVELVGPNKNRFLDLSTSLNSWDIYMGIAQAYATKGDRNSVELLLGIFPDHSQLASQLNKNLQDVKPDPNYYDDVYDPTVGPLKEVRHGQIFDIKPGILDFRAFTEPTGLNREHFVAALLTKIKDLEKAQNGTVYAEDWVEVNDTLNNLARAYGEDIKKAVWEQFAKAYQEYKEDQHE